MPGLSDLVGSTGAGEQRSGTELFVDGGIAQV
jgi:hypothetical protein